jgi:hypothetical protein
MFTFLLSIFGMFVAENTPRGVSRGQGLDMHLPDARPQTLAKAVPLHTLLAFVHSIW